MVLASCRAAGPSGEERYAAEDKDKAKKKKKQPSPTQTERVIVGGLRGAVVYLVRSFTQPRATRMLRSALVHAFMALFATAGNCASGVWTEDNLVEVVPETILGMLGGGTKLFTSVPEIVHARECVRAVLRHGLSKVLGERGKRLLGEALATLARAGSINGTILVVCVLEIATPVTPFFAVCRQCLLEGGSECVQCEQKIKRWVDLA